MTENKWQEYYRKRLYDGDMPFGAIGRYEYDLLGRVNDKVTVHFPRFVSPIESQCCEAHDETYVVTFDDCNMPKGRIDVLGLAGNLSLWTDRGYKIDY